MVIFLSYPLGFYLNIAYTFAKKPIYTNNTKELFPKLKIRIMEENKTSMAIYMSPYMVPYNMNNNNSFVPLEITHHAI